MEQIIPILIAALVFGYQIYANFKKEQDKARKRQANQKPAPRAEVPVQPKQTTETPPAEWADWPWSAPSAPVAKPAIEHASPYKHEGYAESMEAEEVMLLRKARLKKEQQKLALQTQIKKIEIEEEADHVDFDLRQAVIYAAILDRPYK